MNVKLKIFFDALKSTYNNWEYREFGRGEFDVDAVNSEVHYRIYYDGKLMIAFKSNTGVEPERLHANSEQFHQVNVNVQDSHFNFASKDDGWYFEGMHLDHLPSYFEGMLNFAREKLISVD
ncbi:hypothetical protein MJ923_14800 [Shewanella sp. 3B26]|uniref:Uncharacterized protein n=1 Tax=Shewanella zhuhaiensis TaxID=2919576 RepID=A0AAJ1BIU5_9GAMM|nr:hypothetical protein [Shewanella zhuhaiensis]MCH4295575.1 hypothetical protein [Shewanella zhuhaiensis]